MERGLLHWVDISILIVYFVLVLIIGLWASRRKGGQTVKGYFLAGGTMLWFPVGASLFSSNIGSEHFIGLAGSGAASGIATIAFEWSAAFILPFMGWMFLPVYLSSGFFTIPEYLSRRFGGSRLRLYLTVMFLFSCICSRISVDIYAGSVFIQQSLGWNLYISILVLLAVTAFYTIIGGLTAVIYTDTLQTIIMVIGSVILAGLAFHKIGGLEQLMNKYMFAIADNIRYGPEVSNMTDNVTEYIYHNISNRCGFPRADAWHIFRDPVNSDLPWPGLMIRAFIVSMWFWCGDQVIIQRAISAKDIGHARGATIFASYLKFLPMFVITMPGMISRVLYPNEIACIDRDECMKVCENPVGCSNIAYPRLVLGLAPIGLKGLMMSVMVSSMMSSLTSIFNSAATVFTMDLWPKIREKATEKEALIVGKIFIAVLVLVSVAWIPLVTNYQEGQLFIYVTAVNGYIAPPFCAVLLLAMFVPRVNEKGAFYGMLVGHVIGVTRMIADFCYPAPKCGETDDRPAIISKVHAMYFSSGHLFFSALLIFVISLLTRKSTQEIKGLTVWTVPAIRPPPSKEENNTAETRWCCNLTTYSDKTAEIELDVKPIPHVDLEDTDSNCKTDLLDHDLNVAKTLPSSDRFWGTLDKAEITRRKLYIKNWVKHILNINAIILISVIVILFAIFA